MFLLLIYQGNGTEKRTEQVPSKANAAVVKETLVGRLAAAKCRYHNHVTQNLQLIRQSGFEQFSLIVQNWHQLS